MQCNFNEICEIVIMANNGNLSSRVYEKECRDIHDTWGQVNNLLQVIGCRTNLERQQIRETYMAMYGEDLADRLEKIDVSHRRNEVCTLLYLWMLEPHERDTILVRDALDSDDTDYKTLIEIYAGRKSSHLLLIKQAYRIKFKRQLDQDIFSSDPPHAYHKILIALATSHKSHHADVSQHVAKCDAKRLYETGEGRSGSIEESVVLEIFSKRSIPQLRLTFSTYKHIYGHGYTKALKKETYGEFEGALRRVVKCIYNPSNYYAKMLYTSMKGTKTDTRSLGRVLVSRAEIDMDEIQRVFNKKYGSELRDAICETIPRGDHRDFLVALATTIRFSS